MCISRGPGRGERIKTADLLAYLHGIEESPWADYYGKPLSAHGLGRLLKPYRIKTLPVRVEGETVRGYKAEQFADAFARVLGVTGVTGVTPDSTSQEGRNASNACNADTPEVPLGPYWEEEEEHPALSEANPFNDAEARSA